jgi:hypothetical protein
MPKRINDFDAGTQADSEFVTYLALYQHGRGGTDEIDCPQIDIWTQHLWVLDQEFDLTIRLYISREGPPPSPVPPAPQLHSYFWIDNDDDLTTRSKVLLSGKDDKQASTLNQLLGFVPGCYFSTIYDALYAYPKSLENQSLEPENSVSLGSTTRTIGSVSKRGARDRNREPYTIKRSCLDGHRYDESLRSLRENERWGSESSYKDSVFSKGFVDSIMTNHSGKGAFHPTSASSSLPQYSFGDQSAMEQ